jgi:hypothetical protein
MPHIVRSEERDNACQSEAHRFDVPFIFGSTFACTVDKNEQCGSHEENLLFSD